ncbi:uncharacterized protein BXZ73DRAFT_80296 [Epithele typhae]|uniref:uncharacterized protein n=1 Tax=Epithele typhae TaxID=378194 RepID=UPI00200812E6|nr:uncharacterized protein BXZ73DRAFT_80296 [Epithele typhae]KAH9919780.1 hypothetical protein BXZ73DRAFT_80296 [Epithele typhae]
MRSTSLLSLHDDVLLVIFSLLGRNDALATSSTSRLFANVYWDRDIEVDKGDASEARALSRYMRAPEPYSKVPRVQHLRNFTLHHFCDVDVPPLRKLLSQATNLRTIDIHNFEHFVHQDRLLVEAIGAMHKLEQASLINIGPETVASLSKMLSSRYLTSLTLKLDDASFSLRPGDMDIEKLISGLASMQSLHTLSLFSYFVQTDPLRLPNAFQTILPSIRHLSFCCYLQTPLGIITLCPNVTTLYLRLIAGPGERPVTLRIAEEDRWPTGLKRLDVPSPAVIPAARRVGRVDSLALGEISPISDTDDLSEFLQLLVAVRPTAVKLHTTPTIADPDRVWGTLCGVAPGLRSLDIVVTCGECDVREYVDDPVDSWRATEARRVEALRPLPPQIVEALPTLRVLALSSCLPGRQASTPDERAPARGPRRGGDGSARARKRCGAAVGTDSEFVSPALRRLRELRTEIPRDERWWWVEGDGAARTPVEIWREDGEKARELIKDASLDPARSLDGFYSARCRYEW